MAKILFWNVYRKDLRDHVCDLANATDADVVILIESPVDPLQMLRALRSRVSPAFCRPACINYRFQLFSRDSQSDLSEFFDGGRISLRRYSHSGTNLILGLVHAVDRRNHASTSRLFEAAKLVNDVERNEEQGEKHDRTILIGDFNMNPFDEIMNVPQAFNAMMTRRCTRRGSRNFRGRKYKFFFNPTWALLGERKSGPPGTFYHAHSASGQYGWNLLDQVLIRPSAMSWFSQVEIITMAGTRDLRTRLGRPDSRSASDHFPILLTLN